MCASGVADEETFLRDVGWWFRRCGVFPEVLTAGVGKGWRRFLPLGLMAWHLFYVLLKVSRFGMRNFLIDTLS